MNNELKKLYLKHFGLDMSSVDDDIKRAVAKQCPGKKPVLYTKYKDKTVISLTSIEKLGSNEVSDFRYYDEKTGKISGNINTIKLLSSPGFLDSLKESKKFEEDHIEHHGIKGQQWGVRNGPPYPLDSDTHKKVTKSKGNVASYKKKSGMIDPLTAYMVSYVAVPLVALATAKLFEKPIKNHIHKNNKKRISELSKVLEEKQIANVSKEFSEEDKPRKIEGSHSIDDDLKIINPSYDPKDASSTTNCVLTSIAYDLRRRGYDVVANLSDTGNYTDYVVNECYEGVQNQKYTKCKDWAKLESEVLKNNPEGSRGVISCAGYYANGYIGHAMSYEVKNGEVLIYDAQCGDKYGKLSKFGEKSEPVFKLFQPETTEIMRLDNAKIKWSGINVACSERNNSKKIYNTWPAKRKRIEAYKQDHPNTTLNDSQILEVLDGTS